MDPQALAETVRSGKVMVISKERPGHRTQDALSIQDETRLLLVRRRLLQMIGQRLNPSFDEVCEIFNKAMRQMLRAISAVDEFDARHIEFNGDESESSNSDEDEAIHVEECRSSQVFRWEDLGEQHKRVIGRVFLPYMQPLVSAECLAHLCQHEGRLLLWLQHFTFLYAAPRLCWELNPVALATAEDQAAPTPQKTREHKVRGLRLMHGYSVGVERLNADNVDVFPPVGRVVREVGLYHRNSVPADDEDDDEDPLDGVVGDAAAAA